MLKILSVGFGNYDTKGRLGPCRWKWHDLVIVTQGGVSLRAGGQAFVLGQTDAIVVPPNCPFEGEAQEGTIIWVLHFKNYQSIAKSRLFQRRQAFTIRGLIADPFYRQCIGKMHKEDSQISQISRNGVLVHLTEALLAHAEELHSPPESSLQKPFDALLLWAQANLAEGVQVREMAAKAGFSESHFRKKFLGYYGISPASYLKNLRLQEAKRLLEQSRHPIKAISRMTGYADVISFYRAFRDSGTTPAKYRKSLPRVF